MSLLTRLPLGDGRAIPQIGLGVYETSGSETYNAVTSALKYGYRLIDTAEWYGNEAECGRAIRDFVAAGGAKRDQIFYTTKLMTNRSRQATLASAKAALAKAGLDYIDLYLLHSPLGGPQARLDAWLGASDAKDQGIVKSLGVSNFGIAHIQQLFAAKPKYLPVVNQIDLHPFQTRSKLVQFNKDHGIINMAYCPLARGYRFKHPTIQSLAKKYNKSPAQIFVRYGVDKGHVVIPKSTHEARIAANADVEDFSFSADELALLDGLNEDLVCDWEVTTVP